MRAFEEDEGVIHPWDLVVDEGATRVLLALPSFKDARLRERLRKLATNAMMAATTRQRGAALRRLSEVLTRRDARHLADAQLLAMLSSGEPPEDLTVQLH